MANPKIEVEIGAKTQGLRSGVNLAEKELNNLGRAAQQTSPKVNNLSQSISGANGVGIEFSRIIQDAPFGIIGVGNNITQLAGSFSNLQKQTGSSSQALKIAFQSIISPANLVVLGVSAVTTALTLYNMGAFKSKEETKDLTAELEEYRQKLETIARIQIEGAGNAQKEIQNFELLRRQAENTNISLEKRIDAVNELQNKYPSYLGNLSQEEILTGNTGSAYNELTKSIIATAKARGFSDEIAKNSLDLLTIEQQELSRVEEILREREKLESIRATKRFATGQDLVALRQQEQIQQQRINDLVFEQIDSANQRNEILNENLRLQNQITTQIENGASFTSNQKKSLDDQKKVLEELIPLAQSYNQRFLLGASQLTGQEGDTAFDDDPFGIQLSLNQSGPPIEEIADTTISNLDKIQLKVEDLQGAFSGLGSLIGQAFNNQPLGNFFGVFLPFAAKLIATNFKIATSAAATKGAQDSIFGPPFSLPAFIAGAVGVVSAAFASIGGGRQASLGVSGVGGGQAQSFTGGGLENAFLSGLNVSGQIEVDGTKLLVIIENALKKQNRG